MSKAKSLILALSVALPMSVTASESGGTGIKVKVSAGEHVLTATFIDNATSRALIARFPLTVRMMDLYSREVVYRFQELDGNRGDDIDVSGFTGNVGVRFSF